MTFSLDGVQLVDDGLAAAPDPEAVRLGPADVPEMLDLVERTRPGPFLPRTVELGTYLGIRRNGALIAMAGERLHPPGWTEISAVCTDPDFRGEGLATRLILAVAHGIRERGETPFLHTAASNTNAIRLYESLGFRLRRRTGSSGRGCLNCWATGRRWGSLSGRGGGRGCGGLERWWCGGPQDEGRSRSLPARVPEVPQSPAGAALNVTSARRRVVPQQIRGEPREVLLRPAREPLTERHPAARGHLGEDLRARGGQMQHLDAMVLRIGRRSISPARSRAAT